MRNFLSMGLKEKITLKQGDKIAVKLLITFSIT